MTLIKKVIGLVLMSVVFLGSAHANMEMFAAKKDEAIKQLDLTAEQQTQVDVIMAETKVKRDAIVEKYKDAKGPEKMRKMRPEIEGLHAETQQKLSTVLTDEQMIKLETMEDEILAKK